MRSEDGVGQSPKGDGPLRQQGAAYYWSRSLTEEVLTHEPNTRLVPLVIAILTAIARSAAAVLPLTLLSLGLVFVVVVAVLRPTTARQEIVDHLGSMIKDLGVVIAGPADQRKGTAGH